jgi:hypothetical protein
LEFDIDKENGMIQKKIQILTKFALQTIKRTMKNLLTKNLHILSMPWMRVLKITHLQGKNLRKKIYEEGYQPLEEEQESPHDSIERQ